MKTRLLSASALALALAGVAWFGMTDRPAYAGDDHADGASCTGCTGHADKTTVAFTEQATAGLPAAAAFTLTSSEGNQHALSDFAGKHVVLEWFNPSCPFVVKFYGAGKMQALQQKYTDAGVVWLTVQSTNPSHGNYLDAAGLNAKSSEWSMAPTAILMDDDGAVGQAYGATTTPHMYIINPDGKLIYQGAIDSEASTSADDIPGATNYVEVVLDGALIGATQQYGCSVKY